MLRNQRDITELGIINTGKIHHNISVPQLVTEALARGEGKLASTGAFRVETGKYTGRSPNDRFVVDDPEIRDEIDWGKVNVPIEKNKFQAIFNRIKSYLQNKDIFIFDGFAGADTDYRIGVRVINEYAYQNLFMQQLLIQPTKEELESFNEDFTLVVVPGFKCDPTIDGTNSEAAVIISFAEKIVLIAGTKYSGEMKKSVFSVLNYLLPKQGILPMHCSANISEEGDVALFFGLSGTGKTTLSADPDRYLIGDDEHGWTEKGVFNFEGGCYAKTINLSRENEPQIWDAIKFGAVLENVILDNISGVPDYDDGFLTENTRAAYPVEFIPNAVENGIGGIPKQVIFLTADAFGVLPPVAKLDKNQAMYHFLSGYTSKLAGTERGITEPSTTFSACFGAPFLPLSPIKYADLLGEKIEQNNTSIYLVNTGWSGGPYGVGQRMSIKATRAMVKAILNGTLDKVEYKTDPIFNIQVPVECPGVSSEILNPVNTWQDKEAYQKQAKELAQKFIENFKKFNDVPANIVEAGPRL